MPGSRVSLVMRTRSGHETLDQNDGARSKASSDAFSNISKPMDNGILSSWEFPPVMPGRHMDSTCRGTFVLRMPFRSWAQRAQRAQRMNVVANSDKRATGRGKSNFTPGRYDYKFGSPLMQVQKRRVLGYIRSVESVQWVCIYAGTHLYAGNRTRAAVEATSARKKAARTGRASRRVEGMIFIR